MKRHDDVNVSYLGLDTTSMISKYAMIGKIMDHKFLDIKVITNLDDMK